MSGMIRQAEGLGDQVPYAGGHQEIFYYAGFTRSFSDQALLDRFDEAWRELFEAGTAQDVIKEYGLEPAAAYQPGSDTTTQ